MKRIFLYEPSIASDNVGDQVIVDSIKREMSFLLKNSFCVELPTHTPISNRYMYFLGKPDLKMICGSNIIVGKLNRLIHLRQWMLDLLTYHNIYGSIFIGVGAQQYNQRFNFITRYLYRKFFSKRYIHSVRDSYTEKALKDIGINNVINTACPTMWCLTPEFCKHIPSNKASQVVFTLTDYKKDKKRDNFIISTLLSEYSSVYFWPQGYGDYNYFEQLDNIETIKIIPPHLQDFDEFLSTNEMDYVGTRLHGGMRALQKQRRTIIIGVDNRAKELHHDFNIPVLPQEDIEKLSDVIKSSFQTRIIIPMENIEKFKKQFK